MGFTGFVLSFGASLIILMFVETMISNPFIKSFFIALVIGLLTATRE